MNYRHAFHAGNFADVMKHITLALVIEYLKQKPKPFVVIDTHAGIGCYDLTSTEASRTGEWRQGVARFLDRDGAGFSDAVASSFKPYIDIVLAMNGGRFDVQAPQELFYPGAGEIARRLVRPGDRVVLNELHCDDVQILRRTMARDARVRVMDVDGWQAIRSLLPPKERRGVVLIDPPFEAVDEFERLTSALKQGVARFASGIYLIWFPIKAGNGAAAFVEAVVQSGLKRLLLAELFVRHQNHDTGLNGSALLIHNPTFGLDIALKQILPVLAKRLGDPDAPEPKVRWLAAE